MKKSDRTYTKKKYFELHIINYVLSVGG